MTSGSSNCGATWAAVVALVGSCGPGSATPVYQCRFDAHLAIRESVDTSVGCRPSDDGALACAGPYGWEILLEGEVTEWFSVARGEDRWSFQDVVQDEGGPGMLAKVARFPQPDQDHAPEGPAIVPSPIITWVRDRSGVVVVTFTIAYAPHTGAAPAPSEKVVRVALRLEQDEAPCLTEVFTAPEMMCRSPDGIVGVWSSDVEYALDRSFFAPHCSAADFDYEELLQRLEKQ